MTSHILAAGALVLAASRILASSQVPEPLPSFSWETLPVYAETSNVTGPFDEAALENIAKFGLFVIEKAYNFPAEGFAEDKIASLPAELRARAAERGRNITAIFYYNSNLDMSDYRLHSFTSAHAPDWWMQDDDGEPVWAQVDGGGGARPPFPYTQLRIFNHSAEGLRKAWISECVNMTKRGFDGCFVDRWTRTPKTPGSVVSKERMAQWAADRDLSTQELTRVSQELGFWLISGGKAGNETAARANPGFGNQFAIADMLDAAARGQGYLAARSTRADADVQSEMAAFLVAASTNHFFGAGRWTTNHTSRAGVEWLPEYDRPLGEPLGPADFNGTVYVRRFASGTTATFNVETKVGHIDWADVPTSVV